MSIFLLMCRMLASEFRKIRFYFPEKFSTICFFLMNNSGYSIVVMFCSFHPKDSKTVGNSCEKQGYRQFLNCFQETILIWASAPTCKQRYNNGYKKFQNFEEATTAAPVKLKTCSIVNWTIKEEDYLKTLVFLWNFASFLRKINKKLV